MPYEIRYKGGDTFIARTDDNGNVQMTIPALELACSELNALEKIHIEAFESLAKLTRKVGVADHEINRLTETTLVQTARISELEDENDKLRDMATHSTMREHKLIEIAFAFTPAAKR